MKLMDIRHGNSDIIASYDMLVISLQWCVSGESGYRVEDKSFPTRPHSFVTCHIL